jgi:hypothetical protein
MVEFLDKRSQWMFGPQENEKDHFVLEVGHCATKHSK